MEKIKVSPYTTGLIFVGLLCCVYPAAIKALGIPCAISGCNAVINSRFGSFLGIPVALFAIPVWLLFTFPIINPRAQLFTYAMAVLLALGALGFMFIQFFILRGFCIFCTIHAGCAFLLPFLYRRMGPAYPGLAAVILSLVFPIILVVKAQSTPVPLVNPPSIVNQFVSSNQSVTPQVLAPATVGTIPVPTPVPTPTTQESPKKIVHIDSGFAWVGRLTKQSPLLIMSMQCAHCLDLMRDTIKLPQFGSINGAQVLVFAQPRFKEDTVALVAAIMSVTPPQGNPAEGFSTVFSQLEQWREPVITHQSDVLKQRLGMLFPNYVKFLDQARNILSRQAEVLTNIPFQSTPFLLHPNGNNSYQIQPTDLIFL